MKCEKGKKKKKTVDSENDVRKKYGGKRRKRSMEIDRKSIIHKEGERFVRNSGYKERMGVKNRNMMDLKESDGIQRSESVEKLWKG